MKECQVTNHRSSEDGVLRIVERIGLRINAGQSSDVRAAMKSLTCPTISSIGFVLTNATTRI
jgi:tRNA threonylcarbamoyladenosine modification (KEOPS) complex  Pcc1 subunit